MNSHQSALKIQKTYRAWIDRLKVKLKLWKRYHHAAFIIQKSYHKWKSIISFERVSTVINKNNASDVKKRNKKVTLHSIINNVMYRKASYQELITIWKAAIELRRAHNFHKTDILLKSLANSNCDLARSLVLLGNEEFSLKNDKALTKNIRMEFLPTDQNIKRPSLTHHKNGDAGITGIDLVFALRQRQLSNKGYNISNRNMQLSTLMYKSYFSKHHYGSLHGYKKYDNT